MDYMLRFGIWKAEAASHSPVSTINAAPHRSISSIVACKNSDDPYLKLSPEDPADPQHNPVGAELPHDFYLPKSCYGRDVPLLSALGPLRTMSDELPWMGDRTNHG
jgi:hypothetical protein